MKTQFRALVAMCGAVLGSATARADLFTISMNVDGMINGQLVGASATGQGDSSTGIATTDWRFTSIPTGYSVHGSIYTTPSSVIHTLARETDGASNLFTICGGNYSVTGTATFPGGDQILSEISVSTMDHAITGHATLNGHVSLPPLKAVVGSVATWTPGPAANQFIESFSKLMFPADGSAPIPATDVRIYTLATGALTQIQLRDLSLSFLAVDPDIVNPTSATIQYVDTVSVPSPATALVLAVWQCRFGRRTRRPHS